MEDSFEKRRSEWLRGQAEFLNGTQLQVPGKNIRPVDWCDHIDKPSDLTPEMVNNMTDIIEAVKVCHFHGTAQKWRVTHSDIKQLLRLVLQDDWQSGDYNKLAPGVSEPGLEDVGARVGTLRRTLPRPRLDASRAFKPSADRERPTVENYENPL